MNKLDNEQAAEQRIEDGIQQSIHQMTPDLLGSLMDELGLSSEKAGETRTFPDDENLDVRHLQADAATDLEASPSCAIDTDTKTAPQRRHTYRWRLALSAAAILVLVAVGFFATTIQNRQIFAVVGLDVNPSVELSVDDRERVIAAEALNDDAVVVLEGLKLEGTDLNTACHAVVGSMLVKGYLRADSNSILVSIRALDPQLGKQLERQISQNLNSYLENSEVAVAILGQYVTEDEAISKLADEQGISLGKAWLVRKLLAADPKADEMSLLKLSTQDLILLAQEKNVESETSIGKSDTTAFIPKNKAAETALADAGVQKQDANQIRVEFDCEDGELIYEVEFFTTTSVYEYDINARSGQIVSVEVDAIETATSTPRNNDEQVAAYDDDDDDDFDDADENEDDADDRFDSDDDDSRYDTDDDDDERDDLDDDDD